MKELLSNHCCAGTYLLVCDAGGGDNPGGTWRQSSLSLGWPWVLSTCADTTGTGGPEICSTSCSAGLFDPNAVGMLPTCMNPKERVKAK